MYKIYIIFLVLVYSNWIWSILLNIQCRSRKDVGKIVRSLIIIAIIISKKMIFILLNKLKNIFFISKYSFCLIQLTSASLGFNILNIVYTTIILRCSILGS